MGTKTDELITILAETIILLRKYGVSHWADWLEKDMMLLEKSDFYGIEHLLSAFGGMGSFNDLYICQENGHIIEKEETVLVNDKLFRLNSSIYGLAETIRKEVYSR